MAAILKMWEYSGTSKIFMAPIYMAHRVVTFAVAQLSCLFGRYHDQRIRGYFLHEMHYINLHFTYLPCPFGYEL